MNYLPATIKLNDSTDWPRRNSIGHFTAVEKAIYEITAAVEAMGGSASLTKAVCSLQDARNAIADHLEGVPTSTPVAVVKSAFERGAQGRKADSAKE